ncbi:phytanoyl-CoA dioxygenase family protein [Streptomyces sulphureus]|uniref:phytanoyl-CoA dioxygenase family protein n=1 Tax=Streptomyces sulphureus TaxID=47758 RepID=UPI000361BA6C|nr:phytanoyl-CoA dioxygenase family protein [Streptomyces sulphureus]
MIEEVHGELRESVWSAAEAGRLKERMHEDGYLLLRGLLPPERVAAVRADILGVCARHGWLSGARATEDSVAPGSECEPPDPRYYAAYREVVSLESYDTLAHSPALLDVARTLLEDEEVLPRPAKLARLMFPQQGGVGATPPHQDYPHEQATADSYTTWIPMGDVDRALGGVALRPGSHRQGVLEHGFVPGIGGLGVKESATGSPHWLGTEYRMGDVLVFHSLTLHGALPNRSGERLRISADFRYQRAADPMTPHMLKPSGGQLDWPEVYADWQSDEFQYYWHPWQLRTVPYDRTYYGKRDEEAFERAAEGDPHARRFLTTISTRNPDPAVRERAEALLARFEDGADR